MKTNIKDAISNINRGTFHRVAHNMVKQADVCIWERLANVNIYCNCWYYTVLNTLGIIRLGYILELMPCSQ